MVRRCIVLSIVIAAGMNVNLYSKKLTNKAAELLNRSLECKAHVTVRLEFSLESASEELRALSAIQQAFSHDKENKKPQINKMVHTKKDSFGSQAIDKGIKKILNHVKEFFSQIKTNASLLRPLIQESLQELDQEFMVNNKGKQKRYMLEEFFDAPDADVFDYLHRKVVTQEDYYQFCKEFTTFAQDILDSRSPVIIKKHSELRGKLDLYKKEKEGQGQKKIHTSSSMPDSKHKGIQVVKS